MKISCLPVSLFSDFRDGKITIKDWALKSSQLGLDAIDISMLFINQHTPRYLNQIKKDLDEAGKSLIMITTYPDFSNPDKMQVEREIDYLKRDIALASFLGSKYLRILAGQDYPGLDKEKTIKQVIDCFRQVAPFGEKYGVKLVFENHSKPGVWDYPDFSHPTEIFLSILEGIWDTDILVNFDTANTLILGDDPVELLKKIIAKVDVIHASDVKNIGKLNPSIIGEGIVPFKEIFHFLKKAGFNGWICIEEASGTGMEGIQKAADFIRKSWESF